MALKGLKGERTVSELAAEYGVPPTMIHQWRKSLLDGAAEIFERGSRKPAEVDEETVLSLHAKIGEPAVGVAAGEREVLVSAHLCNSAAP